MSILIALSLQSLSQSFGPNVCESMNTYGAEMLLLQCVVWLHRLDKLPRCTAYPLMTLLLERVFFYVSEIQWEHHLRNTAALPCRPVLWNLITRLADT